MTPQQQNDKTCHQTHTAHPSAEAYRAATRRPMQPTAERPMPQRSYDNETQAPTHDALSAIYNRGY